MTQEQKAQAYDEALNKIKPLYEQAKKDGNPIWSTYEYFIPELRESEGERIRVRLIEYFKGFLEGFEDCYKDGGDVKWEGLDVKSILTWLKKQKEQKPAECELEDAFKYYTDRGITISCGDIKAEPKEQELVEVEGEEIQRVFGEDKSTGEWSDTNELVFQDICKHLKEEGYGGWVVLLNALRNGEFQPKPAWNKEDEKIIDTIVSVLGQYIDYKAVSGTCSGYATPRYSKEIDWLKSLRPSWKPSKHQMTTLKNVKDYVGKGSGYWGEGLGSLIDDLEKLM